MATAPHRVREHREPDGHRECVVCMKPTIGEGPSLRHVGDPEPSPTPLPDDLDYAYRAAAIEAVRERLRHGGDPAEAAVDALILGGYFRAKPLPSKSRNVAPVGLNHPRTAVAAAGKALPRTGTLRMQVLDLIASRGLQGCTADEVQVALRREHQSISPIITGLRNDGWIETMTVLGGAPMVRLTRLGNEAEVYVLTVQARTAMDVTVDRSSGTHG